jgi:hypothetical protein
MVVHNARNSGEISGISGDIVSNPLFWSITLMTSAVCLVPFYVTRRADLHFSENIINNLRQKKYEQNYAKKIYIKKLEQMTKATRTIMKFKRLYKDQNMETDNYADKRMKEMVEAYKSNKIKQKQILDLERHRSKAKSSHVIKRSKSHIDIAGKVFTSSFDKISKEKNSKKNRNDICEVNAQITQKVQPAQNVKNKISTSNLLSNNVQHMQNIQNIQHIQQPTESMISNSMISEPKNVNDINQINIKSSKFSDY